MRADLKNRIAREVLQRLLAYSREFEDQATAVSADDLLLGPQEFHDIARTLVEKGLATTSNKECFATEGGLELAATPQLLLAEFPGPEDLPDSLPWEQDDEGRPFERVSNPPPPMTWDAYKSHIQLVWPALLDDSTKQDDESAFQKFLERHPCLLPNSYTHFQRGARPLAGGVFTQPELPGFRAKRPDFMLMSVDSGAVVVLLIEIEAPGKPWSTVAGTQSSKLVQARDQLAQWKTWFREPTNQLQFHDLYRLDSKLMRSRQLEVRYVLVYGRREELVSKPAFAKKRSEIAGEDEIIMTYDRLHPSRRISDIPTLKHNRKGAEDQFEVVSVPPTLWLGPDTAREYATWLNMRGAVESNRLISDERRSFLLRRLDYWDDWIRRPPSRSAPRISLRTYHRE